MKEKLIHLRENFTKFKNTGICGWLVGAVFCLFPFFVVIDCEYIASGSIKNIREILTTLPIKIMPAVIIIGLLFYMISYATKRIWVAALCTPLPVLVLSIVNYFKIISTNIPLLPTDFAFSDSVGDLVGFVGGLKIPKAMILGVVWYVLYVLFFVFIAKKFEYGIKLRIIVPCVLVVVLGTINTMAFTPSFTGTFKVDVEQYDSEMTAFRKYGFLNCFIKSCYRYRLSLENSSMSLSKDDFETDEMMTEKPDVIVILSEAYWNASKLENVEFSDDINEYYNQLCSEGIYGEMLSPSFGGGTVRPEFEILTGLTTDALPDGSIPYDRFKGDSVPSLASYFAKNGYQTSMIHTYKKYFYDRNVAYPQMGIDDIQDMDDIGFKYDLEGGYVPDSALTTLVKNKLEENDTPKFIMAISVENHGPYLDKDNEGDIEVVNSNELLPHSVNILNSYAKSANHADDMLKELCEYLRDSDRPTVVLYYGDHLPFLGEGNLTYVDGGFIVNGDELYWDEDTMNDMHATPFILWSNTGSIESQNVGYIAPYFLGELTLENINAPLTPFYEYLKEFREKYPATRAWSENLTTEQEVSYFKLKGYTKLFLN